jgi:two-component system chemotaxis response regulator CheY
MFPADTRVLVVDDMKVMRTLVKGQLRNLQLMNIVEAENGDEAYKTLLSQSEANTPVGLILSDWNMPVQTGIDFLKKVRSDPKFKALPFILITAEGEVEQVKQALDLGVSSFIRKPFAPATFQEKLEQVWKKISG